MKKNIDQAFQGQTYSKICCSRDFISAKYAPNQNKNISILVIDDKKLIDEKIQRYIGNFKLLFYDF